MINYIVFARSRVICVLHRVSLYNDFSTIANNVLHYSRPFEKRLVAFAVSCLSDKQTLNYDYFDHLYIFTLGGFCNNVAPVGVKHKTLMFFTPLVDEISRFVRLAFP